MDHQRLNGNTPNLWNCMDVNVKVRDDKTIEMDYPFQWFNHNRKIISHPKFISTKYTNK